MNGVKGGQCRPVDAQLDTSKRHASERFGCDVETMFPHIIFPHHTFHSALFLLSAFRLGWEPLLKKSLGAVEGVCNLICGK